MNEDILNEMTMLNNELVNTQRTLVKQNAEILRLNKQLQLTNANLEQFTYVISHDLKEPLRMITSFMGLIKNKHGYALNEKGQVYLNFAIDGGKRLQEMIDDVLELSRVGRENVEKRTADLNEIVRIVKENIVNLIEDAKAEIIFKPTLPILPVFKSDIIRLFQNLLSNAIKFRIKDKHPIIYISAEEKDNNWLFCIEDNSMGIEESNLIKIFEVFARINPRESFEGSGIGLAVCKKVVEQHGGTIWVESEIGKGSNFYFTISK